MTAAVRELREETGITSARLVSLVRACANLHLNVGTMQLVTPGWPLEHTLQQVVCPRLRTASKQSLLFYLFVWGSFACLTPVTP